MTAVAAYSTSASGSAGSTNGVATMPTSDTRSKWNARSGSVARVAAIDTAKASVSHASGPPEPPRSSSSRTPSGHSPRRGRNSAIPATAAKLSWNETLQSTAGLSATITAAARPSAGIAVPGRPSTRAARNTLPIVAALMTEGDAPASSAYSHTSTNGAIR